MRVVCTVQQSNTNMKKFIIAIGLALASFTASAQQFKSVPLINPSLRAVVVTNTFAITNSSVFNYWGTNKVGTI